MKARLTFIKEGKEFEADIELLDESPLLRSATDEVAISILKEASRGPVYSRELASKLSLREQTVYYHVRKLLSLGLLRVSGTLQVRGALAKKVEATASGLAFLFDKTSIRPKSALQGPEELRAFFSEFFRDGLFDGYIVVGSPEPHGKFRASARDGHYATHLALALGSFAPSSKNFAVKLDTDAKLEMSYTDNLVLIGGPATNQLTAEINPSLLVRFDETNYWAGIMDDKGRRFSNDTDALIAKVRNPFNPERHVVVIAGIRHVGTKAGIIALTKQPADILSGYSKEPFACVIRGYDQDGDGKVDSADLIASY